MSESVERPSTRLRSFFVLLMLAALTAAGINAYWETARISLAIARISAPGSFDADPDAWHSLIWLSEDARVQAVLRDEIGAMAARPVLAADLTAVRDRLWTFGLVLRVDSDDEALIEDIARLYAKFGLHDTDVGAEIEMMLPGLGDDPRVLAALLDHAGAFAESERGWDKSASAHLLRLFAELSLRGAGDDARLLAAAATALARGHALDDRSLRTAVHDTLEGEGGAAALTAALVDAAERGETIDEISFETAAERILARPPAADEAWLGALARHCAGRGPDICLDLAQAIGEDAPERLRALAAADGAALAASLEALRAGTLDRKVSLIDGVARGLADDERWNANVKGAPVSRIAAELRDNARRERAVAAFMAMDAEVLPLLHELFLAYDNRAVANLCARVLAARDPAGFARSLIERIDELVPYAWDFTTGGGLSEGYFHVGDSVAEGLRAMAGIDDIDSFAAPFFRALALPEPDFRRYALLVLGGRLLVDRFTDGLFEHLATTEGLAVADAVAYRDALTRFYPSDAIARNLARLLDQAEGEPERVPWIAKLVGLEVLAVRGDADSLALVERFAADGGTYATGETASKRRFADLAAEAAAAIRERH